MSILKFARPVATMNVVLFCLLLHPIVPLGPVCRASDVTLALVEADWLRQAEVWKDPPKPSQTWEDARGAVDGVKEGTYGFHTGHEPNPWWQVDLGPEPIGICKIVVYNRLDYEPGLHNADNLVILTSMDADKWTVRHRSNGRFFGGIDLAKPLEVIFEPERTSARYVRLQIPSDKPIFFHISSER